MSAVVEAIKDVADFVVDAVGDVADAISDGLRWVDDKIIQPVVNTVEKVVDAALDDPIGTIAKIGTAIFAPTLLPLVNGAVAKANGASWGDAFKSAAVSYVAPAAGKFVGASVAPALGVTAAKIAAGASASVVSSTLMGGKDPLGALLSGGISAAMPIMTSEIPGYDQLPLAAQRSINSALVAELTGKDASQAAINSVLATGIDMTNQYLRTEFGLDGGIIPRDLIRIDSRGQQIPGQRIPRPGMEGEEAGMQAGEDVVQSEQDIDQLLDQMGRRDFEDLNEEELASLLEGFETPQQVQPEADPYQGAQINMEDAGFGAADFGASDFGGTDFGGMDFGASDITARPDFGGTFSSQENVPFGRAFAQARLAGDKTFNWQGGSYTTDLASPTGSKVAAAVSGGRGRQGGATAEELAKYFGGQAPAGFDSIGGGRGGQGGPTAEELAAYAKSSGEARPQELGPYVGYPGFKMNPKMGDINQVADPRTLAAVKGFFGQAPDQQGFSVLNQDAAGIRRAGEAGYYGGIGALLAGPAAKGLGAASKGIASLVDKGEDSADYITRVLSQNTGAGVSDPSRLSAMSRQFPNMLLDMASNPATKNTADQALALMNAGDQAAAFRLINSNPVASAAMQQYAGRLGFQQIAPFPMSPRYDSPADMLLNMSGQYVPR
jgi:hypothetical protein